MATKKSDPIKKIELQDGRTRYRFVVDVGQKPDGKRDQRTFTYDTLKEARTQRARIISEADRGTYVRPAKTTVETFLSGWLDGKERGVKASTHRCYVDSLRLVRARHGALPLQKLNEGHLDLLIEDMRSGAARKIGTKGKPLSARSVNVMLTVLGMALSVAVARQLVVRNVVDTITRDRRPAAKRRTMEVAEALSVLRQARQDRLYAGWLLTMLGLRRGEVCGLRWSDIDFTARIGGALGDAPYGTLTVRDNRLMVAGEEVVDTPKSEESERVLPMPQFVAQALKALKAAVDKAAVENPDVWRVNNPDDRVIVHEDGRPVRVEWYSDQFVRLVELAGVRRAILHEGRHTAASLMAHLGVKMVVAAAWLGQSQLSVTAHYQKATWGGMVDASERLEELLTEPAQGNVIPLRAAS